MIMQRQPGCWLRSSHSFKECVIAHWSSEVAPKITGAKLYTEIADCGMLNNVHKKMYIVKCAVVVEEQCIRAEAVS